MLDIGVGGERQLLDRAVLATSLRFHGGLAASRACLHPPIISLVIIILLLTSFSFNNSNHNNNNSFNSLIII